MSSSRLAENARSFHGKRAKGEEAKTVNHFDDGLVQGYWEDTEKGVHVHFYGTNQTRDVLSDIDVVKGPWQQFKGIHQGFAYYADRALEIVHGLPIKGVPAWFTGHSLGAAIAVLLAAYFERPATVAGCPRVGGIMFGIQSRKSFVTRKQIIGDLVTHLPPFWLGYIHKGEVELHRVNAGIEHKHDPAQYQPFCSFVL